MGTDRTEEPKQVLGESKSLLPSWELFLSTIDVLEVEKEGAAPCRLPPSFDFLRKVEYPFPQAHNNESIFPSIGDPNTHKTAQSKTLSSIPTHTNLFWISSINSKCASLWSTTSPSAGIGVWILKPLFKTFSDRIPQLCGDDQTIAKINIVARTHISCENSDCWDLN